MVAMALTIFNGCQKDELVPQVVDEQLHEAKPDMYVENGLIVFASEEQLSKTLGMIAEMSEEERRFWEGKNNFVSQLSIFNDIVDAELLLDAPYENMTVEELNNIVSPPEHSKIYLKYLKKGLIHEIVESTGDKIYDYSTCAPYLVSILNEEGIVVVGNTMYMYAANVMKKWVGCNINEKQKLLNMHETADDIEVTPVLKSTTVSYGSWKYDTGNDRRIRIGINFNSYKYYADGTVWNYTHWVEVQSQKKNIWGNWKYNTTTMYITGTWDYSITYGNQYYPEGTFQNTTGFYDYPNPRIISASNYKSSCSISTGTIYPYGSIMSIMTDGTRDTGSFNQEDLKVIYDVALTDYYWHVLGHAYVEATVEY
jgi:hypothetical protein